MRKINMKLVDEETKGNGIYAAYINMRNPLEVNANGAHWEHIPFKELGRTYQASTDEIADYAKEHGYDGVIIRNVLIRRLMIIIPPMNLLFSTPIK